MKALVIAVVIAFTAFAENAFSQQRIYFPPVQQYQRFAVPQYQPPQVMYQQQFITANSTPMYIQQQPYSYQPQVSQWVQQRAAQAVIQAPQTYVIRQGMNAADVGTVFVRGGGPILSRVVGGIPGAVMMMFPPQTAYAPSCPGC